MAKVKKPKLRYEVFMGRDLYWYWRVKSRNNKIRAVGGETFTTRPHAQRAVVKLLKDSRDDSFNFSATQLYFAIEIVEPTPAQVRRLKIHGNKRTR